MCGMLMLSSCIISTDNIMLQSRHRHLRNRRGFSVAFSNGLSVVFSSGISLDSGVVRRTVTFPVDFPGMLPMDRRCHVPMVFHSCDFWC